MINKRYLNALLQAPSPSGYENDAIQVFSNEMKKFSKFENIDAVENAIFSLGHGETKIMLSAHIDEIALQIQNIDDKGFIHFINDGGIDSKVLLGSSVAIKTENGIIYGVIGKMPLHVEYYTEDKDKATKIKDMKIDIGAESKEEAQKLVSIGDPIIIKDIPLELGENRFCGRGLDDKVGIYVVTEVMRKLSKHFEKSNIGEKYTIHGVACTQEETSGSGAVNAAAVLNPNYSIDYDVTFATDDEYVSPNEWGDIKLGKGGAIAHGVDSNQEMTRLVKDTCREFNIPYQEFSLHSGCTNTVCIKQATPNVKTLLLSIPNRNMHTQVEICDYRDLESLVEMSYLTVLKLLKLLK